MTAGNNMTKRQGRTYATLRQALAFRDAARPPTVDRLESRVLLSGAPAAPLAATQAVSAAGDLAVAPLPVQGQLAEELVPGGVILRSIRPGIPLGSAAPGAPASTSPRHAGAGLDIVLNKGPNLAANAQASAAFEQAAVFFETIFSDPVTVVVDAEVAPLGPGIIGSTGSVQFIGDYWEFRDPVVLARAANEAIAASLPTESQLSVLLPTDAANPYSFAGGVASRANLLALGVPAADLPGPHSRFDDSVFVDMDITFSSAFPFDYDRSDGIGAGLQDFVGVAIHEIAHGLGFGSEVDTVDFLLANPQFTDHRVRLSPLDLFRMRPGEGQANFTSNPRVLAPGNVVANQVVYDGGFFNPAGVFGVPGLTTGDIPMSSGFFRGDGRQASHWKDNDLTGVQIGIMDPTAGVSAQQLEWKTPDNRMMGLIGWDADTTAPAVGSGTFQFESTPNRLRYAFSEPVQMSLELADLLVQRLDASGPVTVPPASFTHDAASNIATFTFNGALPPGNYRATLRAPGVSDFAANALPADHVVEFFALPGDLNRDRSVNGTDFAVLAGNFGRSGTGVSFAGGDVNGDGGVNGSDFAILAGNFGRTVPAPAAVVAPTAVVQSPASPDPVARAVVRRSAPRAVRPRRNPLSSISA
jgi:hypothetical protein